MEQKVITIIGGGGFVGRYVVKRLAAAGYRLRVIVRHPDLALHLKTAGDVGQIMLVSGNIARPQSLTGHIEDSYAVINLAGLLVEGGGQTFTAVHASGAERVAQMAQAAGVSRFIHVSALGVDKAKGAFYARSKLLGEKAVLGAFPNATILRPSVIFGPEDHFFNKFAAMPALPLIGGGRTRFQPVYVGDVARAIEAALTLESAAGETYELGGPHVYSFRQILECVRRMTGRKKPFIPLPFALTSFIGRFAEIACKILPFSPPITCDQVRLLRHDTIVSPDAKTFLHLGITPTSVELIVPGYLKRFRKGGV